MKMSRLPAILCGVALLCAQAPAPPLTQQQLATVAASLLRFRHLSQDITVTADGKSVSVAHSEIQVLNALAVRAAQFPVPYNATLEDLASPRPIR